MEAVRAAIPPDVLEAIHEEGVQKAKQRWRDIRRSPSQEEVVSGTWKRRTPPKSSVEDRVYIPGALRHWRKVHGLSPGKALARIGYAKRSQSWSNWERGYTAPPYETLLRIIAATGLGHWVDEEGNKDVDPDLRLDYLKAAQTRRNQKRRDRRRKARENREAQTPSS